MPRNSTETLKKVVGSSILRDLREKGTIYVPDHLLTDVLELAERHDFIICTDFGEEFDGEHCPPWVRINVKPERG